MNEIHLINQIYINPKKCIMDKLEIKGNWNEIKGKLKQKYANLTDDDLIFTEGQTEELLGKLQKKTGKSRQDLINEIESL